MYVDDTSCCHASSDPQDTHIQRVVKYAQNWASSNDMRIHASKTKEMVFSFAQSLVPALLTIGKSIIERVNHTKLLGVTLSWDLTWNGHILSVTANCNQRLFLLIHLRRSGVPAADLLTWYKATIRPSLEYAAQVWHSSLTDYLNKELEQVQRRALCIIYGVGTYSDHLIKADLPTLHQRRLKLCESFYRGMRKNGHRLHRPLPAPRDLTYSLRVPRHLLVFMCRTQQFRNSFVPSAVCVFD